MRKIAVVTGTRAEYGLLYWIIKGIHEDPELELQLIVTGMHLSPEFGNTVREIERDGFPVAERVEMLLSSDTEEAIATSMGLGMIGFAKAYERLKPDILLVLGDRFEIFSAVGAAIPFRIPVAHIHGGEATEGAFDEQLRHAITKMSHIHFPAVEDYRKRIIQMGERPQNVYCFGSPAVDNIRRLQLKEKDELYDDLDIPFDRKVGVVTYHPVTLEKDTAEVPILEILKALKKFPDIFWVFTQPNADTGGRIIIKRINEFVDENPNISRVFTSLGQIKYLSLLKYADIMVGNSSSGLVEAPSFELPVVNIGDRQSGRIRAQNVMDVPECKEEDIKNAIDKALSSEFKSTLKGLENPYGKGFASEKIVEKLKTISISKNLIKKSFYEILS
ncbi:UDP-N-acetylglucosamine 2-epimerase [uncultured archaeon]|nr:UDP-N-acetylglucosamine 2-epimerase [uncultured archaeon]